jgi:hypothetical protein
VQLGTGNAAQYQAFVFNFARTWESILTPPPRRVARTVLGGLWLIRARIGECRERAKAQGMRMGRKLQLPDHQKREAIKRRDKDGETLAEIGRSYNVSGWTISRLAP